MYIIILSIKDYRRGFFSSFVDLFAALEWKNIKKEKILMRVVCYLLFPLMTLIMVILVLFFHPILQLISAKDDVKYYLEDRKKKKYLPPVILLKLRRDKAFLPNTKQIIYVENSKNELLNCFFHENYEKINQLFKTRGYNFVFIPNTLSNLDEIGMATLKYHYPNLKDKTVSKNDIVSQDIYNTLFSLICEEKTCSLSGFIRYKYTEDEYEIFSYLPIRFSKKRDLWKLLNFYIKNVGTDRNVAYSITVEPPQEGENFADESFYKEIVKITEEIRLKIDNLRQLGVNELVIKSLFTFKDEPQLSRLLITKDYRIILLDYNELEIKMTPLVKAVYFLFLKYPEGILFKHLSDYRSELVSIYSKLSNRDDLLKIEESIDDIVDSTKNSINEKCSRIRESFIKEFDEKLAQHYFILGGRSEPKKIPLDRTLIIWESNI